MKKQFALVCCLAAAVALAGCATLGGRSDRAMIDATLETWAEGMETRDMDLVAQTYSEDFTHWEYPTKADLMEFMRDTEAAGYLNGAEVTLEYASYEIDEEAGVATVYPVELIADFGSATLELELAREDDGWKIVGQNVQM
jgi:hypothetical protein